MSLLLIALALCSAAPPTAAAPADATAAPWVAPFTPDSPRAQVDDGPCNITFHLQVTSVRKPGATLIVATRDDATTAVRLRDGRCALVRLGPGAEQVLGEARDVPLPAGEATVTVKLRPGWTEVELGGGLALRAYVTVPPGGEAGLASEAAGVTLTDAEVQPVADIGFQDDFFAADDRQGIWETLGGSWRTGVYWDPKQRVDSRPIGASWYETAADGPALTAAGADYWEEYRAAVTLRGDAQKCVGLAFGLRNAGNYGRAMLTPRGGGEADLAVVEVLDGTPRVLGSQRIPYATDQWHRLEVLSVLGTAIATVDGGTPLEVQVSGARRGRVGLYADGPGQAQFDDVAVTTAHRLADDFATSEPGLWRVQGGEASVAGGQLRVQGHSLTTVTAGDETWGDVAVRAAVAPRQGTEAGLLARASGSDYYAFGVRGTEWRLWRPGAEGQQVLASGQWPGAPAATQLALEVTGPRLQGLIAGVPVVTAYDFACREGSIGLYAQGEEARFDDLVAEDTPSRDVTIMTAECEGRQWPNDTDRVLDEEIGGRWQPGGGRWALERTADGEGVVAGNADAGTASLWYYEVVPGDAIVAAVPVSLPATGEAGLALCCPQRDPTGGYAAALCPAGGQRSLVLRRQGVQVASLPIPEGALAGRPRLELRRDGRWLVARAGTGLGLVWSDPDPLPSGQSGVWCTAGATFDDLSIGNADVQAYPFDRVEPDWVPAGGLWQFHSGMACLWWSHWLSGDGREGPAAIFLRGTHPANLSVRFVVGEYSEGHEDGEHQHFPYHDCSLVLCGRATDPAAGYRLVVGEGGGQRTRLYREGVVVAETDDPAFRIAMAGHCNAPRAMHISVTKHGGELVVRLQGREALRFSDPAPLAPGQIGLGVNDCRADFVDFFAFRDFTWE